MTPTQFTAKTRNLAKQNNLNPQLVQRHFMMDHFVEAIAESEYKEDFILKGGFLLGSKYGIQNRTTTDLDTTLRNMKVTKEKVVQILDDLTKEPTKEGIQFKCLAIEDTRLEDFYPGFKISMQANLEKTRVPFSIDLTTGDSIIPDVTKHEHKLMFEEKTVVIYAFPTEQIISDKLHATVYFGLVNSRSKDFYDLYTMSHVEEVNSRKLYKSARNTFNRKGLPDNFSTYYKERVEVIKESQELRKFWSKYQSDNFFAQGISYEDTSEAIDRYFKFLMKEERMEQDLNK